MIPNASLIRIRGDYEDFCICSAEDAQRLIEGAESFLNGVPDYLKSR